VDKLTRILQREQKSLIQDEDALSLEVHQILSGLDADLLQALAAHDPSAYTQNAARERHLSALIAAGGVLIGAAYRDINKLTNARLIQTAIHAAEQTEQALSVYLKVRSLKVSEEYAKALASNMLVDGAIQRDWWATQAQNVRQRFTRAMREGLSYGEALPDLIRRVRGRRENQFKDAILNIPTRQAQTLARTSLQTVAQQGRLEQFRKHSDVIQYIVLSATMDDRVTPECRDRNLKKYTLDGEPVGHDIPFNNGPPYHYNCRTQLMPETKSL